MEPTSEERIEVAERLRNLAGHIAADEELTLDALGLYRGENIEGYDTYGVMHLADLIDPTCHIVLRQSDSDFNPDEPHYLCSRCGKEAVYVYERRDYTLAGIVSHARYCSYCGARVVDE